MQDPLIIIFLKCGWDVVWAVRCNDCLTEFRSVFQGLFPRIGITRFPHVIISEQSILRRPKVQQQMSV